MNINKTALAHVLGIITVAIWGVTFVNTKYLIMGGLDVKEIFLLRFSIAYFWIWLYTLYTCARHKQKPQIWAKNWKDEVLFLLLGISGGSLYFTTENLAVSYTYANNVSFIVCTAPIITIFLAKVFTNSVNLRKRLIFGSLIALVGVAIVIFNGHFVLKLSPKGDLLALAAATCWAVYSLLIKNVSGGKYGAVFITRKVFAYGIITILPVIIASGWQSPLEAFYKPSVYGNLIFLGTIASFLCFVVWSWVIKQIGALKSSNYVYLNPVTTVVASAIALDEPMTALAYWGSALILGGVALANSRQIEN